MRNHNTLASQLSAWLGGGESATLEFNLETAVDRS